MFDPTLRVPFGYSTATRTLAELEVWLLVHHHPEYVRRLLAWLSFKAGEVGVGGGWRAVQPTGDTFAPAGKSFHQDQGPEPLTYSDGFRGACAVDVVKRNPGHIHATVAWSDVPAQGSKEAALWGVHANVDQGATPEPWHIQPVEIDGWSTWMDNGRPAPSPNYPLPGDKPPPPEEIVITPEDINAIAVAAAAQVWQQFKFVDTPSGNPVTGEQTIGYIRRDCVRLRMTLLDEGRVDQIAAAVAALVGTDATAADIAAAVTSALAAELTD